MPISATALRQNMYRILDEVIETGKPVEVLRKGTVLTIGAKGQPSRLSRLKKRKVFDGDPDEIIGMDWLKEWSELK